MSDIRLGHVKRSIMKKPIYQNNLKNFKFINFDEQVEIVNHFLNCKAIAIFIVEIAHKLNIDEFKTFDLKHIDPNINFSCYWSLGTANHWKDRKIHGLYFCKHG